MPTSREHLSSFNAIIRQCDESYRRAVRALGMPDCAFWILYFVRESSEPLTQSVLCTRLYLPKQTINSALKKLEGEGLIALTVGEDRRSRYLHLTERGEQFAARTVDHLIAKEVAAMDGMTPEQQETFIALLQQFADGLRTQLARIPSALDAEADA